MTTTINASTSSGLVVTPDNSGNVLLQYNGQSAPAFYVYNSADQSISSNVETKVTLDTEVFDTNNNFASSRFTPTVAGYYQLNYGVRLGGTSISAFYILVFKNGTYYSVNQQLNFPSGNLTQELIFGGSNLVYCNGTTDYVELYINLVATSPKVIGGRPTTGTYFSGCLLRGA